MRELLSSELPQSPDISAVNPRSEHDAPLFAELAEVLRKHDAIDRFGVVLLHEHFDVHPGECLLETTDVETRTQTIRPVSYQELEGQDYTETSWRLGDGFVAMRCVCQDRDGSGHRHYPRR